MDISICFLTELPTLYDDFPLSPRPRDRGFAEIVEGVPNLTTENNLALLNLAAIHTARMQDWTMMKVHEPMVAATRSATLWPRVRVGAGLAAGSSVARWRRRNSRSSASSFSSAS